MNKSELIKKLEDIEWEDFEVKEAKSEIPKNSWETVSAFSNTAGGWLIFGVSKKGKFYNIIGVSNPEKIEQDFTTILRNGTKFNRKITVKPKKYNFSAKTVLAFYIPQQSPREKPVYFNSQKNTFIRTGSGDQRATQEEIDSFYRNSSYGEKDKEISKYYLEDLNKTSIEKYRNYFMNVNPGHRYNELTNSEFLHKLGVLVKGKVTFGGLLVFGTEDLLMETITNYRIEYLEISGISYEDAPMRYSFRISSEQNLWTTFLISTRDFLKKLIYRLKWLLPASEMITPNICKHLEKRWSILSSILIILVEQIQGLEYFQTDLNFLIPVHSPRK